MISALLRGQHALIASQTLLYLRDCYDHTIQLIDVAETFRETCTDLRELYLAEINQQTSEVTKVLTIIATLFLPISFVAGVYGMNFDPAVSPWNMPELKWAFGYPFALILMIFVEIGLLVFFWRRGWFSS
jgi:magnesium transporter